MERVGPPTTVMAGARFPWRGRGGRPTHGRSPPATRCHADDCGNSNYNSHRDLGRRKPSGNDAVPPKQKWPDEHHDREAEHHAWQGGPLRDLSVLNTCNDWNP